MDSENVFDIYNAPKAPIAPSSKKKTSKQHPGESSKAPPAKKTHTANPPADGPSTNATPPPSPLEQQTPPAPVRSTPSPPAPTEQTQQAAPVSTGGDISSRALRSVKDRVAKILKHERCRKVMAGTETMDVDQILIRTLNGLASAMLTLTAGRLRSGAITEQSRALEQRHAEELKVSKAKYTEQLEAVLEEKNKMAEELREKQTALDKAIE
ncbi:lysine-rich arabinogalactan protein 18-like [Humulus lupulus]|uniref:lysine-rich arabinogalactan protein 18-like n=1 Tax=Humulus lupulus TaxID=3486 RepID=UPI002B417FC5|nr:lysine-rich arabinogalactan protein 18-like [Humulus lupulus]